MASVQGTVEAKRVGETAWRAAQFNDRYCPGDTIRVGDNSRADLALANRSVARLNAGSTLVLKAIAEKRTSLLSLIKGAGHFFSRGPRNLEVETPYTVVGVRGTEFWVSVEARQTLLSVFEGDVLAANETGELALSSGQSAVAESGKAPVLRLVANPRDAVRWALYYPPVIDAGGTLSRVGKPWRGAVQQSVGFYLQGDLKNAFEHLQSVPETVRDVSIVTYRASLLLAVGQIEAAEAAIAWALQLDPNDRQAAALQTIIAVVHNDKAKALRIAQAAVSAAPDSATARIALSYAQQAQLNLEGARANLDKAVELEPGNALAWARLAELRSSFGLLDQALAAARRAVDLEPGLSRTQTVLGFAFLTQVKTTAAQVAFEKAIALDQADPLPRLGLGLAKIRAGQLDDGSQDIEIAASLDPNNALLHSYLGKARFEQKLAPLDARQYGVAKKLDPQDPTPWFYDAIRKQTENRPVEALRDLQKATELNDNRAVYRSRLLLDSDLAARSASLARIYRDLGFQQLALVEGWRSVNTDPSNFSAHRFLADSYSVLPRHEIARVSELLQSQLLQPINLTPIQPRLAESNQFLISAGGPGALSFNEFNPIFNRNGVAVQTSSLFGENDTWTGEGVVSGIVGRMSFSVGYAHFESDGFRQNSDQEDDLLNVFAQVELSHKTSLQAEFRRRDIETGDLQLRFFSDGFLPNEREKVETTSFRLGLRHALSPSSIVLGSFMYQQANRSVQNRDSDFSTELKGEDAAYSGELQHLFRSRYLNIVSGLGHFNVDSEDIKTLEVFVPGIPLPPLRPLPPQVIRMDPEIVDRDVQHTNLYLYSYIHLLQDVIFTVGGSGDFFDSDISGLKTENQFNPKFGVIWNPSEMTTVRGAVFRTTVQDKK